MTGNMRKGGKDGTFLFSLDHSCVKFCNDFMMIFPFIRSGDGLGRPGGAGPFRLLRPRTVGRREEERKRRE